jgi:hypothetical protein
MRTTVAGHIEAAEGRMATAKAKILLFREGQVMQTPGDFARSIESDITAASEHLREAGRTIAAAAVRVLDQAERTAAMLTTPAPRVCNARGESNGAGNCGPKTTRVERMQAVVIPMGDDDITSDVIGQTMADLIEQSR